MGVLRDLGRWRFWRRFITHAFAAIGVLVSFAGLVDVFSPGSLTGQVGLIWAGALLTVAWGGIVAWPRPISASFESPKTTIKVIRGDLFQQKAHLVVGACDTFDTAYPYISPNSVQGKFLAGPYDGDVAALDRDLLTALKGQVPVGEVRKDGKTKRYELGTVATIRSAGRRFFLVAYTSMDENNKAHATADGLWKSLGNLWESVRIEGNGSAIAIPIIGGGQSGLSPVLPAEDAIRLTALSFMIASRKNKVCDELRIVALPDQYDRLDHFELQAFLRGLRRS